MQVKMHSSVRSGSNKTNAKRNRKGRGGSAKARQYAKRQRRLAQVLKPEGK